MKDALLSPAAFGFYAGFALFAVAFYHLVRLKFEHARYKKMLGDKMEIEAATMSKMKQEMEAVKKENENLRIKIQTQNQNGDVKNARDLEVFARAEKKMMVAAPGFAGPWEQAKQAAYQEMAEEDAGKSAPKRFFQRFFGGAVHAAAEPAKALPDAEPAKASAE